MIFHILIGFLKVERGNATRIQKTFPIFATDQGVTAIRSGSG